MNFLGHLYFSNDDTFLMKANLYGDFIKGKDISHLPEKIQEGVRLHRKIDDYIDTHPAVIELLHKLYEHLPKVSGIAVDLYFDHLLAKNWKLFHKKDFEVFIYDFYATIDDSIELFSKDFHFMLTKMKEINWLYSYQFMYGLEKSSEGVSSRISFPNNLSKAPEIFLKLETEITNAFHIYMEDAKKVFLKQ
jgi:acyl carrier protein phosphodiesterase